MEGSSITSLTGAQKEKSSIHHYKCSYCKKTFMTQSFLQMHCRRRHYGPRFRDPVTHSECSLADRTADQGSQSVALSNEIPFYSRGTSMGRQAGQMALLTEKKLLALQKAWKWAEICIRDSQDICQHVLAEREANAPLLMKATDEGLGNRSAPSCLQCNCDGTEVKSSIAMCGDEQECGPRSRPCSTAEASTQHSETTGVHWSTEVPSKILCKGSSSFQQQIHAQPCYSNNQAIRHKIHPGVYSRHQHCESIVLPAQDETRHRLCGKNFLLFVQEFDASLAYKLQRLGIDFAKDTLETEVCQKALHEVHSQVDQMIAGKSAQQQGIYHEETRAMWKHLENIAYLHRTEDPSTKPVSTG
uniref:C2H2-type domain-containing protein n=1 Tax=Picocystis salinarum TaxID=88271 RepID=A0A7S3UA85_9CHLO